MAVLALYQPRVEQLVGPVTVLFIGYIVLCIVANRMKLSVPLAAAIMAVGCVAAIVPDILRELHAGSCGRDVVLVMTAYLYAGRGGFVALAGMSIPLVIYAVVVSIWKGCVPLGSESASDL